MCAPPCLAALAVAEERTQGRDCAARWASPPPSRRRLAEEEEEHRATPSRRAPLSPPVLQPFAFCAAVSRDQRGERDHERDVESASRRETLAAAVALCRVPSLLSEHHRRRCRRWRRELRLCVPGSREWFRDFWDHRRSLWLFLPSPENPAGKSPESDHRCRLGWLMGLPPNRFGDRRYFGSAVPSVRYGLLYPRLYLDIIYATIESFKNVLVLELNDAGIKKELAAAKKKVADRREQEKKVLYRSYYF
ncbi:hypothetical protein Ahy_B03g067059 [Arachis hypogaea]|uniref:Uncharacterized protein n=1 Tax=Arachis hypogaea TaxID=3818 RepID=A0A445A5J7_ARAHY|nr:hypothetical protein Ahy_B03g067059 [Arachis hypogaea]